MTTYNYEQALEAADYIRRFLPEQPETVIVSGSGLGGIADAAENTTTIDVADIPHWPGSTAPGHAGKIIIGRISSSPVIIQQGRVHYYEGHSMKAVTFPVRVFGMLGVRNYIATNAAGAINTSYSPGDIIAVRDHINLMGANPLSGSNDSRWNERFPDMSHAYSPAILSVLESFGLRQGVYAAFMGPSFETPAEVKMAGFLGADLAGMSTVPEVITANAMGLRVAVLSCVANMAAGIEPDKTLTGQEVLDVMKKSSGKLAGLLVKLIKNLNQE
ncbi:MAG: purine-nucleoside phosphorylase [Synergistaceae bacterium]|nr:purine-nucleoside phosphorylase [Synergistaceae bacterium]